MTKNQIQQLAGKLTERAYKEIYIYTMDKGGEEIIVLTVKWQEGASELTERVEVKFEDKKDERAVGEIFDKGDGTGLCKDCKNPLVGDEVSQCGKCAGEEPATEPEEPETND